MTEFKEIASVRTAFRQQGKGADVILLHGWGQNMEMMQKIEDHLKDYFHVYNLDFPGFGESDSPAEPWSVNDYEHFLQEFIRINDIHNPILIAHSFGCRVAIRYAADNPGGVRKMCLTGAAGIRGKRSAEWYERTAIFKSAKAFLKLTHNQKALDTMKDRFGAEDYKNAQGVMKPTFVKVVNDDVTPVLHCIKCPVLLVWGEKDTAVPLWMGKEMEKEMPDAGLAVFQNDDHFAYYHQSGRFNKVLDVFLKQEMNG